MSQDTYTGSDKIGDVLLTKIQGDITELFAAVANATSGSGVKVSATDTVLGTLITKLLKGPNLTITQADVGGNETLVIGVSELDADINGNGKTLLDVVLKGVGGTVNNLGILSGGTNNINWLDGNIVTFTVGTDTQNITASNWPDVMLGILLLTNAGSQALNLFTDSTTVAWVTPSAPVLATSGMDLVVAFSIDAGSTVYLIPVILDFGA